MFNTYTESIKSKDIYFERKFIGNNLINVQLKTALKTGRQLRQKFGNFLSPPVGFVVDVSNNESMAINKF